MDCHATPVPGDERAHRRSRRTRRRLLYRAALLFLIVTLVAVPTPALASPSSDLQARQVVVEPWAPGGPPSGPAAPPPTTPAPPPAPARRPDAQPGPPAPAPGLPDAVILTPDRMPRRAVPAAPGTWLDIVNAYRALAGLPAVTENAAWSAGGYNHSVYMVKNNEVTHFESPAKPFYTADGDAAGQNGNVFGMYPASQFSHQAAIDAWMLGPFHQLGIVDPKLQTTGYGSYTQSGLAPAIEAAATLDVIRGRTGAGSWPVRFPAPGASMPLRQYSGGEFPDPLSSATCAGYTLPTGPPITLQLSTTPNVTAHSFKKGSADQQHCWYDETTYTNPTPATQTQGRNVLQGRHAVVIIPRAPLTDGTYTVSITSGGTVYTWSFTVGAGAVQRTLTVQKSGTGSGTVTSSPGGIDCGATCSAPYADGTTVTLTASAATGSAFAGWSGCDATSGTSCTVTMSASKTVTATFNSTTTACSPRPNVKIQVARAGNGRLAVTLTAGRGTLREFRVHAMKNVVFEVAGQQLTQSFTARFLVPMSTYTFTIRRLSGTGSAISDMWVQDECGDWHTFVGGGPNAW